MTEEEQKRFTPSELLLYKHALEYRCEQVHLLFIPMLYQYIHIQTQFIQVHTGTYGCQTKYIPQVDCCRAEKDKADQRAEPGSGWTPAELNHILTAHVVDGAVTTFGCVEWESQLFRGVMRARCYPFNLPKRRFHSFNPQVHCTLIHIGTYQYVRFTYSYIPCLYEYVQQYTKNDIVALLLHRILF